jgi:glycosyltransferase involved in cell wall biosynthesis
MTASSRKLYYLGKPADGFGWGVANTNLVAALSKHCQVIIDEHSTKFDAPVFVPIADSNLHPLRKIKKAPKLIGYCFTEWPLTDKAERESRQYDHIFTGSDWNTRKLQAAGIKHCSSLQQGIDFSRFTPQPPSDRKGFVIFSGGKYEYRKGQDYVIAALRTFLKIHSDAVLIAAWHNPWPQSVQSMSKSWLIDPQDPFNDLPKDRVILVPPIPNAQTPQLYAQAHVGLFPNRCEAGTNLVMCEFMASQRPVIATYAHGHMDVLNGDGPLRLTNGSIDPAGWFNPNVSDILANLEYAYSHRDDLQKRGEQCRKLIEPFTWEKCAEKVVKAAFCDRAS